MTDDLDVTKAIAPKSDQLNGDDLLTGPRTIRFRDITQDLNAEKQNVWIYFDGDNNKPWKPCKTVLRALTIVWKTPNMKNWIGKHVTVFRDPDVVFGASKDGGIRVSHVEGIDSIHSLVLTAKRGKKAITIIKPLDMKEVNAALKPDRETLRTQMDSVANDADAKAKWWNGLNADDRAVVKELANGGKANE